MSSTFSTNLAIELIGTGDQAGAWGNTTNTNLGTLIEQAISGYVTQAVITGTDTTITIPNGATGVARNMFIELTGTGGASTNLIVPANKKLYFIYNNSTGAVTVKVSGQTGVSVPTGKKMVLVSNGTDIVNGLNYIADFGTNSFTVTNLTATSATITTLTSTSAGITTLSGTSATLTTLGSTSANITTLSGTTATYTSATISNLNSTSANIATLTGTNFSATSLTLTNALRTSQGGTGVTTTPTNGQLLIGNGSGYTVANLTAGFGITVTNSAGGITLAATNTASGTITAVTASSPLASSGGTAPNISISSSTGSGAVVLASGASFTATSADITTLTGTTVTYTGSGRVNSLGVGTAATGTAGEIVATNNVTAYYSDARLKNFQGTIPDALEKVKSLGGYLYVENEVARSFGFMNDAEQVGVSAQEVAAVMPHVVALAPFDMGPGGQSASGKNYMTVRYERLVPLLIEAIKELSAKVEALEKGK